MSALEKLQKRAEKKIVIPEPLKAPDPEPKEDPVKEIPKAAVPKEEKKEKKPAEKKKHAGGRKRTRGEEGIDYKMVNIAIPMEIYEKLLSGSEQYAAGNLTFYINSILKEKCSLM